MKRLVFAFCVLWGAGAAPALFAQAPAAGPDAWKYQRLYAGVRTGLALQIPAVNTNRDGIHAGAAPGFEGAAQAEVSVLGFTVLEAPLRFSVQTEAVFGGEKISADLPEQNTVTLEAAALTVPLLAKLAWMPRIFALAVFTGPAVTLPLGRMTVTQNGSETQYDFSPTLGLTVGINAGVKAGPGLLFLDIRYYGDCIFVRANDTPQYRRQNVSFSLGYRYGFLPM